ncbi:hypothetical protein SpCBS45565_g08427 [Spizellomyces sp. 'palustris']|nr:hypothetical protein SpCBS45565_g08427 [Spizellomyces sp. 'palustris']
MQRDILIVGAGPSGLAALKALKQHNETRKWTLVVAEQRHGVGGVWLPSAPTPIPPDLPSSPIYDSLTTNLPHPVMAFYSHPFPPATPLFPGHPVVLKYLQSFAERFDLWSHIRFGHKVVGAEWDPRVSKWRTRFCTRERKTPEMANASEHERAAHSEEMYDAILVCSGHYHYPKTPDWPGVTEWALHGRTLMHACYYRRPQTFRHKVVLVVGAGPSGRDLSNEVATVSQRMYHSVPWAWHPARSATPIVHTPSSGIVIKPPIRRFHSNAIEFEDGTQLTDVDIVIAATGYFYRYPFFPSNILYDPSQSPEAPSSASLLCDGSHVEPLYQHMFPITPTLPAAPNLIFFGLPSKVVPFPLFEIQALVATNLLLGKTQLPAFDAIQDIPHSHDLPNQKQFAYCNSLAEWGGVRDWQVKDWVVEMYAKKDILRKIWQDVERRGEEHVQEWVGGVEGEDEWINVMRRLIALGEERFNKGG